MFRPNSKQSFFGFVKPAFLVGFFIFSLVLFVPKAKAEVSFGQEVSDATAPICNNTSQYNCASIIENFGYDFNHTTLVWNPGSLMNTPEPMTSFTARIFNQDPTPVVARNLRLTYYTVTYSPNSTFFGEIPSLLIEGNSYKDVTWHNEVGVPLNTLGRVNIGYTGYANDPNNLFISCYDAAGTIETSTVPRTCNLAIGGTNQDFFGTYARWPYGGMMGMGDAYFWINKEEPPALSTVQQYYGPESDVIAEGGTFVGNEISISSQVSDPLGHNVKLEVELRPSSESFNDADASHIYTSGFVSSGNNAVATIGNLIPKDGWYTIGGDSQGFHWRARARNEGGSASGWVEMGENGNTDFVAQISLPMKAAGLAVELVNYPYLWGGKGWDFDQNKFVPVQTVQTGYKFYNPNIESTDFGAGVDCSGLVMWSYDRSNDPTLSFTKNVISYEGAGGQYSYNSQTVSDSDLAPGDLMFFNWPSADKNKTIDHVAMYVGPTENGNDVVEAKSRFFGIVYSKKSVLEAGAGFLATNGFHRVNPPSLASSGMQITLGSPGYLSVTDPDGNSITKDSVIPSDEEYIREIPGEMYYSEMEKGADGYPITRVYSPKLKQGNYVINVIPREGVSPSETYSLDFKSGTETVNLAQHVPIGEIPSGGYKIAVSDGGEIMPVSSSLFCPLLTQSATYSTTNPALVCAFTNGPKTMQLKDSACNPIAGARVNVRKANGAYLTYVLTNADGLANLSGYTNPSASYFEVDYHGATYSTSAGTFSTGTSIQTHSYELSLKGSDCNPITGARVNLRKTDGSYVAYATTNADGKASFEVVPNASMKLEADYHGGTWMSEPRGPDTNITLGTDKFSLVLSDSSGRTISGTRANLRKENNAYVTYATTNDSGLVSFEVLPNVPMVIEVDYHGVTYQTASSATHEQVKVTTIPLGARLLESTGAPISGSRVNLRKADGSYVTYGLTNVDGTASFEVVPHSQMRLEVDYHGSTYLTGVLDADTTPLTSVSAYALSLELRDSAGNVMPNARVNLRKADNSYVTYALTNDEGIASFQVLPGSVMILEANYNGGTYKTAATTVSGDITLRVQTSLITVHLTAQGQPLANMRVDLLNSNGAYITYGTTDGAGELTFDVFPQALHEVRATYNGTAWISGTVTSGSEISKDF